jgi:hypothetical protein
VNAWAIGKFKMEFYPRTDPGVNAWAIGKIQMEFYRRTDPGVNAWAIGKIQMDFILALLTSQWGNLVNANSR